MSQLVSRPERAAAGRPFSGDTTRCKVTPVILHGAVPPEDAAAGGSEGAVRAFAPNQGTGKATLYKGTSLIRKRPPPYDPPYDPRHRTTVGS